ncbi:cation-transporting P-type ATPase [Neiella marina]|uniref:Cation-transporting P-type ATPase n=1 Tax=Neiella holothuriorum TaxID=2870530 RepID=A0ABS7ELU6_9GAMM|nr:cation-transporting P-type ATPase [Neiella holothuriorum]MBW8192833.1 cation-transporting P-type ATPase [Neiella holothuriorum]
MAQSTHHSNNHSRHWHHQDANAVLTELDSGLNGLSCQQAEARLHQYGPNQLPETKPPSALLRFLQQFNNVLIYVLLAAGIGTLLLQHFIDASVIFAVVFLNALIGFIQEGKAEDALRKIRQMLSPTAEVIRDSHHHTIDACELVPGDLVQLHAGDKVPADLRLVSLKGLQIQESALTGESVAVEKSLDSVDENAVLGDRRCMCFSSTLVTHGQGIGVVVHTGAQTEIGRISNLVSQVSSATTPLLRQMAQFGRWLSMAILVIAACNFVLGIALHNYAPAEMFLASVSLAVAAIPEGLPAIMTITLAIGVQRMARRNAILRRLPAVETLGAVTVICSDKTGTLTRNEMTLRSVATAQHDFEFEGTGYAPHGGILKNGAEIMPEQQSVLWQMLHGGVLCNESSLENKEHSDTYQVVGDPMEGALLIAGLKAGLEIEPLHAQYPRTDLIPFESEHRFMATLNHGHNGDTSIWLKGAPEQVLQMCRWQQTESGELQPINPAFWSEKIHALASCGQRVLAIAMKPVIEQQRTLHFADVETELVLLGLFGLIDPPRDEAIRAVERCHKAGIRVKMITGDHAATAKAIAQQLNLTNSNNALIGSQLIEMDEADLRKLVEDIDVYARVDPEHKLQLVQLLQERGEIAAMTGDGVNDAPALKRADVGIAMGKNGTEAAKEASEMVLADDNFASISHAIEEGRTVYDNLKKAILFILPTNGGEALIVLAAVLLGFNQLPLTPVQILWVNMITAVTLALSLAFEPSEKHVMARAPRDAAKPLLSPLLIWRVAFVSVILASGTIGLYLWQIDQGQSVTTARTVAVNTLVMFEIFYLFNSRYISASVLSMDGMFGNKYVLYAIALLIAFQLAFTYFPPLNTLFGTAAINLSQWLAIIGVSSSVFFLVEAEKALIRRW